MKKKMQQTTFIKMRKKLQRVKKLTVIPLSEKTELFPDKITPGRFWQPGVILLEKPGGFFDTLI